MILEQKKNQCKRMKSKFFPIPRNFFMTILEEKNKNILCKHIYIFFCHGIKKSFYYYGEVKK